jgi:hypothetical protein
MKEKASIEDIAHEVTVAFRAKRGSESIAQEDALVQIGKVFQEVGPRSVLDLGAGIGTISFFLSQLENQNNVKFYLYEVSEYCQAALLENLEGLECKLIKSADELERIKESIDFVVIDDFISQETTFRLLSNCRPKAIFIEGHRRRQRRHVYQALRQSNQSFMYKNFRPTPVSHKVGCLFRTDLGTSNVSFAFVSISGSLIYIRLKTIQAKIPFFRSFSFRRFLKK